MRLTIVITSITYSKYVSLALVIQHAKRTRNIAICDLSGSNTFFHSISKQRDFLQKKVTEHKICVFDVITSFFSGYIVGVGRVRTVIRASSRIT